MTSRVAVPLPTYVTAPLNVNAPVVTVTCDIPFPPIAPPILVGPLMFAVPVLTTSAVVNVAAG